MNRRIPMKKCELNRYKSITEEHKHYESKPRLDMTGVMGAPDLTTADDPLAALAMLHDELNSYCAGEEEEPKTTSKRKKHYVASLKAKAAIEAIKGKDTLANLAKRFGVRPTEIRKWKKRLLEKASELFEKNKNPDLMSRRPMVRNLS
jgi:hypothetical protein